MTDTKYPLCEKAGFDIKPCRHGVFDIYDDVILAKDVESLLSSAPVVYGHNNGHWSPSKGWVSVQSGPSTHTARLLLIEPIVRDTAESLLREFVAWWDDDGMRPGAHIAERARALLAKGGGNG